MMFLYSKNDKTHFINNNTIGMRSIIKGHFANDKNVSLANSLLVVNVTIMKKISRQSDIDAANIKREEDLQR
jgi:hypothetical protein